MWVHIILFVLTFGIVLVWKAGWIRLDGIADRQSMRLFLLVAVCGNLLGMALTMTDGKVVVYQEGHRMEKTPDGAYTEELLVSVNGQKPQKFDVEIPEKETEETEVEPEQEVNETEQRQKELREIIEEYNQQIRIIIICRINGTVRNLSGRSPVIRQDHFWHRSRFLQRLL